MVVYDVDGDVGVLVGDYFYGFVVFGFLRGNGVWWVLEVLLGFF